MLTRKKNGKMRRRNVVKIGSMKVDRRQRRTKRGQVTLPANFETMLMTLHTHASQLSSAEDIDTIVKCTLDAMEFTLGFGHAYFLSVENGSLRIKGSRGRPVTFSALRLGGRGVTVKAANTKRTFRISDTRNDPDFVDPRGSDWKGPPSVLSELVVPIIVDAEAVAVLCVDSTRPDNFSEGDQKLLETLAVHVASELKRLRHEEELEDIARLLSETPSLVFRLNGNGTILYANQASNALLQTWESKVGGRCPQFWQDLVKELLEHQTSRVLDVDIQERTYSFQMVPVPAAGYVNAYGRNITERKQMESALRESEEKYRAIVENSPHFTGIFQDGVLKYINNTATLKLGWTYDQLLSPSFDAVERVVTPRFRSVLRENIGKRLRGEEIPPYEISLTRKDGSEVPVLVRATKIIHNQKPAIEFVFDDITEIKRADEKLRESAERYRSLFQSMMEGFAYCQMIFDENGRPVDFVYIDVNTAFGPLTGLGDVVGKRVTEVIPGIKETNPELFEIYGRVASTGKAEKFEVNVKPLGINLKISVFSPAKGYFAAVFENITARKRADEKLRQSEERFHSLFDRILDGVYSSTHEGRFVDVNPAFVKMFGYSSKQEMLDIKDIKKELYFSPTERGSHILDTSKDEVEVYQMRRKDGSEIWVEDHGRYVHDEQGNIIYHEGILRDVTERRRLEEELKKQSLHLQSLVEERTKELSSAKERLEFVIQSNPAVIFSGKPLADLSDWVVTFVSNRMITMLGYHPEELVGHPEFFTSHIHPDDLQADLNGVQALWKGGRHIFEYRFKHKDGSYRLLRDEEFVTRDATGKPIEVNGYWVDITEQKQAEEALKASESKYRELFDASPVALWEEDFSLLKQFFDELRQRGVSNFAAYFDNHPKEIGRCASLVKVLNVNKATLRLQGAKSMTEIVGGLGGVLIEETNLKQFAGELVALAEGRKYYEAEMENRTLRGETKQVNVICAVVPGYEKSLAKVLVCLVDLTPQKKLERELVRSQRLAAIGETAGMVGHDLRNPLQGIAGASYNIRRHLRNTIDPSTEDMLEVIDNGVQYANGIVNDLLEFSREMQLQLLPATPKSIATQTLMDVKIPSNIIVEDTTANVPEILVDQSKFKRVLTNLIQNAVDAMPDGGKLSIDSTNAQKEVWISVRDTGVGIPRDEIEKIWTPLYTTKARGIGLGMAICKRIIEAHGGSITIESTVGKGTTFTLKLPMQNVHSGGEPV